MRSPNNSGRVRVRPQASPSTLPLDRTAGGGLDQLSPAALVAPAPSSSSSSAIPPSPPVTTTAATAKLITCNAGRYVRQVRIGKGAFKEVYRAMDEDEGIEVAWNEIDFTQCITKAKIIHEVELLQKLNHPNIIRCFSSWEDERRHCLIFITELMTSGTLQDFISQQSRHTLNRHAIAKYGRQVLMGLAHLHSKDVIHRDLKCSNVFINGNKGEVKIGDLGVSIASRHATSVIGTPEYMAPEMFGEHYTNAIDMWSFGLCMLEMSTGLRPYHECDNIGQIYKKLTSRVLPSLEGIQDAELLDVIHKCLQFEARDRPTAEQLLAHPLFHVEGDSSDESNESNSATLPGFDNDSFSHSHGGAFKELPLADKVSLMDWLKQAPSSVRSEIVQFACHRMWIDTKDVENINLSHVAKQTREDKNNSSVGDYNQTVPLPYGSGGRSASASSVSANPSLVATSSDLLFLNHSASQPTVTAAAHQSAVHHNATSSIHLQGCSSQPQSTVLQQGFVFPTEIIAVAMAEGARSSTASPTPQNALRVQLPPLHPHGSSLSAERLQPTAVSRESSSHGSNPRDGAAYDSTFHSPTRGVNQQFQSYVNELLEAPKPQSIQIGGSSFDADDESGVALHSSTATTPHHPKPSNVNGQHRHSIFDETDSDEKRRKAAQSEQKILAQMDFFLATAASPQPTSTSASQVGTLHHCVSAPTLSRQQHADVAQIGGPLQEEVGRNTPTPSDALEK